VTVAGGALFLFSPGTNGPTAGPGPDVVARPFGAPVIAPKEELVSPPVVPAAAPVPGISSPPSTEGRVEPSTASEQPVARPEREEEPEPELSTLNRLALDAIRAGKLADMAMSGGDRAIAADERAVTLESGSGTRRTSWGEFAAEDLFTICENMGAQGDAWLEACAFGFDHGLTGRAEAFLHRYLETVSEEGDRAKAHELLAEVRQEEVPEGGYVWNGRQGVFENPRTIFQRKILDHAEELIRRFERSQALATLERTFPEILECLEGPSVDPETREAIVAKALAALREMRRHRVERLLTRARRSSPIANLAALKRELNRRRTAALEIIFDEAIYVPKEHPDYAKGDEANGQARVDGLVDPVRELWNRSGAHAMDSATRQLVEQIRAIDERYYAALGVEPEEEEEEGIQELLHNFDTAASLSIRSFSLDAREARDLSWNRRVAEYNAALKHPDLPERVREHVRLINEYREMMGRRACFIDVRLNRACEKHSRVCDEAGKIWHEGADGTPTSRAKEEGYPDSVAENIAIGYDSPGEIWTRGWYRSSGHHRNVLQEKWTCMGYGYVGRVGTQNFGDIPPPKGL